MNRILIAILGLVLVAGDVRAQEVMRLQNGALLSLQNGAILSLTGGIDLENGSSLTNNGTITLKRNSISGISNWTDHSTSSYTYGTGTVVLNSSGTQTVNSKNVFQRINVNDGGVNLASDITSNKFYLIQGVVNTNAFHAIAPSASQLAVEADPANPNFIHSWFNGNLRRYITPATINSYSFPLGNATQANLAILDNLQTAPLNNLSYLEASFTPRPGTDAGLLVSEDGTPYSAVNDGGVWHITPDLEPSAGKYDLQLYFNGFTGLADNDFAILKRPDASADAAEWIAPSGSTLPAPGSPGRMVSSGYARRNGIANFSQFGIGMTITPLPVTLVNFEAHRNNSILVSLHWETVLEQMNKGFAIERRRTDDSSFSQVGFVSSEAPGGNSGSELFYNYTDTNSYTGISYYRLKQLDLDNQFVYSLIRAVPGSGSTTVSVKLFPNPASSQFTIHLEGTNKNFNAFITDELGQLIRTLVVSGNPDTRVDGLPPGAYIIRILNVFGKDQSYSEKILIVK